MSMLWRGTSVNDPGARPAPLFASPRIRYPAFFQIILDEKESYGSHRASFFGFIFGTILIFGLLRAILKPEHLTA